MSHSKKNIAAALAVVLFAATSAYAGDSPSEINQRIGIGNPVVGKEKSALCQGCHGEGGNSESGTFPKLAGQWADYIEKQVRNFQNLYRINETMNEVALTVPEFTDLHDIAAYFASQKQMSGTTEGAPTENEVGKKLFYEGNDNGAFRCVKCHGERGKGEPLNNNLFPVLGGQHKEYIIKQLTEFKSGYRDNDPSGMMARVTSHLSPEEIEAVADYLSSQGPTSPPPAPAAP